MSLNPFFVRPWYDRPGRAGTHSLFDQFFGQPLFDDDLLSPLDLYWPETVLVGRRRPQGPDGGQAGPLRSTFDRSRSGLSHITNNKNEFTIALDVQHFKPEEVSVKTDDRYVTIEAKHEEKEDEHGYIQRHFVRKYMLPDGVKPETVKCALSSDGVLSVSAPKQTALEEGKERVVPITRSPHPALQEQGTGNQEQSGGSKL